LTVKRSRKKKKETHNHFLTVKRSRRELEKNRHHPLIIRRHKKNQEEREKGLPVKKGREIAVTVVRHI
jgi:hypothetical protein